MRPAPTQRQGLGAFNLEPTVAATEAGDLAELEAFRRLEGIP